MRVVLKALLSIGVLIVLFLSVILAYYQSLDSRKKAELWFSLQKSFVQGSIEEQRLLHRSIEADSTFAQAYMEKSVSLNKQGDFPQGMQLLNRAVHLDPIAYLGYRGFVKLYMLRDYEGAINDFLWLDSLTPGARDAPCGEDIYYVIGLSYQQMSAPSKALEYFNLAIDKKMISLMIRCFCSVELFKLSLDNMIKPLKIWSYLYR